MSDTRSLAENFNFRLNMFIANVYISQTRGIWFRARSALQSCCNRYLTGCGTTLRVLGQWSSKFRWCDSGAAKLFVTPKPKSYRLLAAWRSFCTLR